MRAAWLHFLLFTGAVTEEACSGGHITEEACSGGGLQQQSQDGLEEDDAVLLQLTKSEPHKVSVGLRRNQAQAKRADAESKPKVELHSVASPRAVPSKPGLEPLPGAFAPFGRKGIRREGARSTSEALRICTVVMALCIAGYAAYCLFIRLSVGVENHIVRLALLGSGFGLCTWATHDADICLDQALGARPITAGCQMLLIALFTFIYASLVRSRLTGVRDQVMMWAFLSLPFAASAAPKFITFPSEVLVVIWSARPLLTLPFERLVIPPQSQPFVTKQLLFALFLIASSSIVHFQQVANYANLLSLGVAIACLVLSSAFLLAQRRLLTTECKDLSIETCMLLENLFGYVPAACVAFSLGEASTITPRDIFFSEYTILLILSGLLGTAATYLALSLQRELATTSYMVVESAVGTIASMIGVICFLDPLSWPLQGVGLIVRVIGTIWFGKAQYDGVAQHKALESARKTDEAQVSRVESARRAKLVRVEKIKEAANHAARALTSNDPVPSGYVGEGAESRESTPTTAAPVSSRGHTSTAGESLLGNPAC